MGCMYSTAASKPVTSTATSTVLAEDGADDSLRRASSRAMLVQNYGGFSQAHTLTRQRASQRANVFDLFDLSPPVSDDADVAVEEVKEAAKKQPVVPPSRLIAPRSRFDARLRLRYAISCARGKRDAMEDRVRVAGATVGSVRCGYFGVFDGHNGAGAAEYATSHMHRSVFTSAALPEQPEEALRAAFAATDGGILADAEEHSGATAACLLVLPDALVVGCVGDTHVVLSQGGKAHVPCVVHRPTLPCEVERVARAGGNVLNGRVCGVLAVSRALGDADLKLARADPQLRLTADVISAEPDVVRVPLSPDTECAILATDGLLDVVEPQLAVTFVRAQLAAHGNVQQAARALVDEALRRNSADNVSVVLVCFHQEPPEEASPCCSPRSNNNTTTNIIIRAGRSERAGRAGCAARAARDVRPMVENSARTTAV